MVEPAATASGLDGVRASRDGHQYHEAWAARVALELIPPGTDLAAIAIEGFSPDDQDEMSQEAHDIADLVRYRGGPDERTATTIEVVQFKYSVGRPTVPMLAGEMRKTLCKFAAADTDYCKAGKPAGLRDRVRFELVTNRPIDPDVQTALVALREGRSENGRVAGFIATMLDAIGLTGERLADFARRLTLTGTGIALDRAEHANLATLASWSGATDSMTELRLGQLRKLLRDRAGSAGQGNNVVTRVDLLGALAIAVETEIYPVEAAFPPVAHPIERELLDGLVERILADPRPLLVHAAGGFGKTVIMQSLAQRLEPDNIVLLFDGFGAGRWRDTADSRHLPRKAFPHLANRLAAQGLCDILIPGTHDEDMVAAFRDRLTSARDALRHFRPGARIVLLLDAVDHCGMQAARSGTTSFAHLLLETLSITPIDGVVAIASCRSHRRGEAQRDADCRDYQVPRFTRREIASLVRAQVADASEAEFTALERRANGNPRYLDGLLRRGRPFDRAGPPDGREEAVEALLATQIEQARSAAIARGASDAQIRGLLAGLALLPPPVPVAEIAAALDVDPSEIDGFVADLFPLIEATATGLIFRDEPTETLVVAMAKADPVAERDLVARLERRQAQSIYAARALPAVLTELGEVEALVNLAFADPPVLPGLSKVAQRAIRMARIKAAAIAAARGARIDDLLQIALEAGRISRATERSDAYLRDHPDMVGISGDPEAIRRLRDDAKMWGGRRHATLAVLDIFTGDEDAARLEAGRAISWINWNFRMLREEDPRGVKNMAHVISDALLIELLDGQVERIGRFLARQHPIYAYGVAARILRRINQLALTDPDGAAHASRAIAALETCRSACSAALAAMLQADCLSKASERRFVRKLATQKPDQDYRAQFRYNREVGLDIAFHSAAAHAIRLGLPREARDIVTHAPSPTVRSSTLSDGWQITAAVSGYLRDATLMAATRSRPTRLLDIAPGDMLEAVPASIRARGPSAFEKCLDSIIARVMKPLKPRSVKARKAAPKDKRSLDRDTVQTWQTLVSHQLPILASYVDAAAAILRTKEPAHAIREALAVVAATAGCAENYPLRGQKGFLIHRGFELILWAASQAGPLDQAAGDAILAFTVAHDIRLVDLWLDAVHVLARSPACHASAVQLAQKAARIVEKDTDLSVQIGGYGRLAGALWPMSRDEARIYFRRGLDLADDVGSDDQEPVAELLEIAGQYGGPPLDPQLGHRLGRLCELNFSDDAEAFPWRSFGQAFARIAGPAALAQLTRYTERDKADLGWTMPPLIKALVETGRLAPDLAAAITGLASFRSTWDWRVPTYAEPILNALPPGQRSLFADDLVLELDREDGVHIGSETLASYKTVFDRLLPPAAPARRRIDRILAAHALVHGTAAPEERSSRAKDDAPAVLRGAKAISAAELDALLVETGAGYKGERPPYGWILTGFVSQLKHPAHRQALLDAAMASALPSFGHKLEFLRDAAREWRGQSLALDANIADAAGHLGQRHLDQVIVDGSEYNRPLAKLATSAGDAAPKLVVDLIGRLAGHGFDISSGFWMASARILAAHAAAPAIAKALDRFTALTGTALPDAIGDGPWQPRCRVDRDEVDIAADLIWMRLGAPDAAERWRAAHVVQRLARFGRFDVIDRLMAGIERRDAGAFQDHRLTFYAMHAKLWLLIAIARLARDFSERVIAHRPALEAIAGDATIPHILWRHFAIDALRACLDQLAPEARAEYATWLDRLNQPSLPAIKRTKARPGIYDPRPKNRVEDDKAFRFDYDFDRKQLDRLGNVFGLAHWSVGDVAGAWVRRWDPTIEAMWDCQRSGGYNDDYSRDGNLHAERDRYGGYLGRHAIYVAAGELAATHPVSWDRYDDTDPWDAWLRERLLSCDDGLWLSDGLDPFPLADLRPIGPQPSGDDPCYVPKDPLDLLPLAGFEAGFALPGWLCVAGDWTSAEGCDVQISSRLVLPSEARVAALAAQSGRGYHCYLPFDRDDSPKSASGEPIIAPWLGGYGEAHLRLDTYDPYGMRDALGRSRPDDATIATLGLTHADRFGRTWRDGSGQPAFLGEAWGRTWGRGRHRTERHGDRLMVRGDSLKSLLVARERSLILLIRVRQSLKNNKWGDDGYCQTIMTCLIAADGTVEGTFRLPRAVQEGLKTLGRYERDEFAYRLTLIRSVGRALRQNWPRNKPLPAERWCDLC